MAPLADVGARHWGQSLDGDIGHFGRGWRRPGDYAGGCDGDQGGTGRGAENRPARGAGIEEQGAECDGHGRRALD